MKRFHIFLLPLLILLSVSLAVTSCRKSVQTSEITLVLGVDSGPVEVEEGDIIKSTIFKGMGPLATDFVCLKGIDGTSETYLYPIEELSGSYFTFKIWPGFKGGKFAFYIKRGDAECFITNVEYTLKDSGGTDTPTEITPDEGTTVYGLVSCNGAGIPGVQVSDGYLITTTDNRGVYQLKSEKKNKYVFITVPSGYEVSCEGSQAIFYRRLRKGAAYSEQRDFALTQSGDQTNHTVFLLGDMHLTGTRISNGDDRTLFKRFTSELNSYVAAHSGEKMYAFTLGDMTWDQFWYTSNYYFDNYVTDMNEVKNLPVFNTIGNHDNDMKTSVDGSKSGWDAVDWDTAGRFRDDLGPNYYSVNIGKVHYVVVDNIYCTNTTGGTSSDRHYEERVSSDNLAWLKKDLAYVSKSTPVVVMMHAAFYNQDGAYSLKNASDLAACFSGFSDVTFVTGHTHKIWSICSNTALKEHNSGAICGCWWWCGHYVPELNLAQDGAPSGYRVMEVKGTSHTSYFKGTERDKTYQFRSYDLNQVLIDNPNISTFGGYDTARSDNKVLINVWDYDQNWKVEVTENGKALTVTRAKNYDPLFIRVYFCNGYKTKTDLSNISFKPMYTNHMFTATASSATSTLEIKVTDDEGRVYTETMTRPKKFELETYK